MSFKISAMNCHYRFFSLESFFRHVSRIGFEFVEIWTSPQHFYVDYLQNDDIKKLKYLSYKYKINIQCICPEQTNPKPHNIAARDSNIIERTYTYYKRIIDIAKGVGADKIVTTSGWGFLDEERKEAWDRSVIMQKKICEYALGKNIKVCLEALQPIESNLVNNVEDLKKYFLDVNNENLNICIDFGAMAKSRDNLKMYFEEFGSKIAHIHFVDGNPTGHLAIGDGERDYRKDLLDLKKYNYDKFLTLETASDLYYQNPYLADEKSYNNIKEVI